MSNELPLVSTSTGQAQEPAAAEQAQPQHSTHLSDHGNIDYSDPAAVRDLICRIHPFGDIFSYEGIVEACRLGQGRELVAMATPPDIPQFDSVPLAEMNDPPVDWVMSFENLERRAFVICATGFYGTDEAHKAAIESVRDAGVVGLIAQANLQPPEKPKRRKSDTRRYGPRTQRACPPNLFKAFDDE
jgi:hypothetical protein